MPRRDDYHARSADTVRCPACRGQRAVTCPICGGDGCSECKRGTVVCEDCDGAGNVPPYIAEKLGREW